MLKEFKEFATRGNVVDLATGIVIGAAFTSVVNSFVDDILMPPIGRFLARADFSNLFITLGPETYETLAAAQEAGAATINYGLFIANLINFIIVAFVIFLVIRQVNRMRRGEEKAPTSKECPFCFTGVPIKASRCPNCTSQLAA